jgi:predicted molibdopterin-dependent oxidoreductase YjgC
MADLLQDQTIECLYLVGIRPRLRRAYQTVILQNIFSQDFVFDIFLPSCTFLETSGNVMTLENTAKKLRRVIAPLGQSQPDEWIFSELRKHIKGKRVSVSRKVREFSEHKSKSIAPSDEYPYILLIRENCYAYHDRALSQLIKGFERLRHDNALWVDKTLAAHLNLLQGQEVQVIGSSIDMNIPVRITDTLPDNTLVMHCLPSQGLKSQAVRLECTKS